MLLVVGIAHELDEVIEALMWWLVDEKCDIPPISMDG
jgi:hypothetical protein